MLLSEVLVKKATLLCLIFAIYAKLKKKNEKKETSGKNELEKDLYKRCSDPFVDDIPLYCFCANVCMRRWDSNSSNIGITMHTGVSPVKGLHNRHHFSRLK